MKTTLIQSRRFACICLAASLMLVVGCTAQNHDAVQQTNTDSQTNESRQAVESNATASIQPSISQGFAKAFGPNLLEGDVAGWRVTAQGKITSTDGKTWTVPGEVNYRTGPKAADLYNECNDVTLPSAKAIDLSTVPVKTIDADGETITAYFFGDNYAELYINGQLVAVDPVPYWPFNTSLVRFKVKRPFTVAARLVDWEENLGLGSEVMKGVPFHTGDGGFVAVFKNEDGETIAKTDDTWLTQIYYVSPIADPSRIGVSGGSRNSDDCEAPAKGNAEQGYAAHWPIPADWAEVDFDDTNWAKAHTYSNEDIGGSLNRPAFANFKDIFDNPEADADFIWSSNLLLDNVVLTRKVVE